MNYKVDHDYHIHSQLSSCSSDPEQTAERLLRYAKENGLKRLVVADHYWDNTVDGASSWYKPQDFQHISEILPLPQTEGIEFLFGCETEMDKNMTLGIPRERFDDFDFIVIPTTHMHMVGFTIPNEAGESVEMKARLWVERLDALLSKELPFRKIGIPHLACSLMCRNDREGLYRLLDSVKTEELWRVFGRIAEVGAGIELNYGDMRMGYDHPSVSRIFKTAKECGCKFYCASDAHHPKAFSDVTAVLQRAADSLGLTEDDKFHIAR